jgi:malonyl-CoA/methylmalonyl-CoA synthetase
MYFLEATNAAYLLTEPNTMQQATKIKSYAVSVAGLQLETIPIDRAKKEPTSFTGMEIDEKLVFDANRPCLVIFTSGTTGRPKGVVVSRRSFFFQRQAAPDDVFLAHRPVHAMGGATGILSRVLIGTRLHLMKRRPEPAVFWEILKEGRITGASLPPAVFKELEDHYRTHISHLPSEDREKYIVGAAKLRGATNSGSMMNPSTPPFWKDLTGMKIQNVYASTELGGIALMTSPDTHIHVRIYSLLKLLFMDLLICPRDVLAGQLQA